MKNKRKFLISVVLVVAINACAFAVWWLASLFIIKEKEAVQSFRAATETLEKEMDSIRSFNSLLSDIKQGANKISAAFLNSENIVKFIEELEFLGQKTGIELDIKSADVPAPSEKESPLFKFQIKGSFKDVFQFIYLIENLPYETEIKSFSLTKSNDTEWRADFEVIFLSFENI